MKDLNNEKPEIYIVTSNRSAGKTTYFTRWAINKFLKKGEKFIFLYRYNYELADCADKIFKDVKALFFPDWYMSSKTMAKGCYCNLFLSDDPDLTGECCGYALAVNSADNLKKYSHLLSDANVIIFDEFQSETNHYAPREVQKLISLHTSLARGQGQQVKYLPIIMISNPVSIVNPYYVELGISARLKKDTKFLRGNGFVLEQGFNNSASKAQKLSGFNRAFAKNDYVQYSAESVYLNDDLAFIETPAGCSYYYCTLIYKNRMYAIRSYPDSGIIYCDKSIDETNPVKIAVTVNDHDVNRVMIEQHAGLIAKLKHFFNQGLFRFKDLECKDCIMFLIGVK